MFKHYAKCREITIYQFISFLYLIILFNYSQKHLLHSLNMKVQASDLFFIH